MVGCRTEQYDPLHHSGRIFVFLVGDPSALPIDPEYPGSVSLPWVDLLAGEQLQEVAKEGICTRLYPWGGQVHPLPVPPPRIPESTPPLAPTPIVPDEREPTDLEDFSIRFAGTFPVVSYIIVYGK